MLGNNHLSNIFCWGNYYKNIVCFRKTLRNCWLPRWISRTAGSFIIYIKTDDIYKDIAEDAETTFDTSNYELNRPLPKRKNKVVGLMKDELGGKII